MGTAGNRRVSGCYLIGADGGRSTVRKALDIAVAGYTHAERFLVLTTPFSFDAEHAQCSRNYFSDPDEWCALFKVSGNDGTGLWRVLFPTRLEETDGQAMDEAAVEERLQLFFPKRGRYPVVHRNLYTVHQRVAASFGKGRVFLAGDAAHVNNPLGGLGLNFGIHDAIELSSLLGCVPARRGARSTLEHTIDRAVPSMSCTCSSRPSPIRPSKNRKDPRLRANAHAELRRTARDPAAHRTICCAPP